MDNIKYIVKEQIIEQLVSMDLHIEQIEQFFKIYKK